MSIFPIWSQSQSVGNGVLDEQHKTLLDLVRQMIWLALPEDNRAAHKKIYRILADIAQVARNHFETEEKILAANGFPGLAGHKAEHDKYLNTIADLLREEMYESHDPKALSKFVAEHMYDHLLKTDKECEDYLTSKLTDRARTG
jgi:hemerythrin